MAVLTRTRMLSNQRLSLTAYENIESFVCTDFSQLLHNLVTNDSYIVDGLQIYQDPATTNDNPTTSPVYVKVAGSMILHTDPANMHGALFVGADSVSPTEIALTDNATNFIEAELTTETGSPDTEVFWDPSAGGGLGEEFTQIVDTVTNLVLNVTVNTSGFTGAPKLRIAQITMSGGTITSLVDKRDMFFRLAKANPELPQNMYSWPNGTDEPNPDRKLDANAFVGADKAIQDMKTWMDAIMTEIYRIKFGNTPSSDEYWFSPIHTSLGDISNYQDGVMYSNGTFTWNLATGRVVATDQIVAIFPDSSGAPMNTISSSEWSSVGALSLDQDLYYVDVEPENDGAALSLVKATTSTFTKQDNRVIVAKRVEDDVILSPLGVDLLKLSDGETSQLRSELTQQIIQFIGAANPADSTPPYTELPSGSLVHQFTSSDSLVTAISANTGNINDIVEGLQKVYRERLEVVGGAPADDNEVQTNGTDSLGKNIVTAGTNITLPLDSRDGDAQKEYLVGNGALLITLNGQMLTNGEDFTEVGTAGTLSSEVQFTQDLYEDDSLEFIMLVPEIFGGALGSQPYFVNYVTGQTATTVGVGALYNVGTDKLAVWRNGLFLTKSPSVGDTETRYTEATNNSIELGSAATSTEVFAFVNHSDPQPAVSVLTAQTGTLLTVPSYLVGSNRLRVFRNGILMSTDASAPSDQKYSESSSTTITLDTAATSDEVFVLWNDGSVPSFREELTGVTGTVLTIPNGETYVQGDERLLVFRNGVLLLNTNNSSLGSAADRYTETSTTQITLETAATASDFFTFLRVNV